MSAAIPIPLAIPLSVLVQTSLLKPLSQAGTLVARTPTLPPQRISV